MNNKKVIITLVIIVISGAVYLKLLLPYYIQPKYNFNKYVLKFIEEEYEDYQSYNYKETYKCWHTGGIWFAHNIDNCYISKYEIKTKSNNFNIYVTNKEFSEIYVFAADSQMCIDEISSTDGHIYENHYSQMVSKYSDCVIRLK